MIRKTAFCVVLVILVFFLSGTYDAVLNSNSTGPLPGKTGSPGDAGATCNTNFCHSGAPVTLQPGWISLTIPPTGYIPGNTYTITVSGTHPTAVKFGFESTAENTAGTQKGTLIATDASQTQIITGINGKYISHTLGGVTAAGGVKSWTYDWTAPTPGAGTVIFYAALNAANGNGFNTGDTIYTTSLSVQENTTAVADIYAGSLQVEVFPNPADEKITVSLYSETPEEFSLKIFDVRGTLAENWVERQPVFGKFETEINLKNRLAPGIYFIAITAGEEKYIRKILVR